MHIIAWLACRAMNNYPQKVYSAIPAAFKNVSKFNARRLGMQFN